MLGFLNFLVLDIFHLKTYMFVHVCVYKWACTDKSDKSRYPWGPEKENWILWNWSYKQL